MLDVKYMELHSSKKLKDEDYQLIKDGQRWRMLLGRGECRTGGYDIRVEKITFRAGILQVTVRFKDPDPHEFVTMMITYPTREYMLELEDELSKTIFQAENGDILKVIHI